MIKKFLSGGYIFLVLAFIYIPIFLLIVFSFNEGVTTGTWIGFSLKWYERIYLIKDVVINTVLLAVISATISTILGTFGAIGIYYSKNKLGKYTNLASQIPVVNSEVVTACALVMLLLLFTGQNRSIFGLYLGHVVLTAPFVVLSVMPKLKQMDGSLYEAALDLGDTPFKALFKVVMPQILPGIFAGFMLAITLSLDDYIVTATLAPIHGNFETISTAVYKAIARGTESSNKTIAVYRALTTIIFVVTVAGVLIMNIKSNRKINAKK